MSCGINIASVAMRGFKCGWVVHRVAMLEEELGRMNPDMTAIAAFQAKEAEYAQRVSDLEAATAERDNVSWHCMLQHRPM